jgi:adenosylhomocysteine nucleosidase
MDCADVLGIKRFEIPLLSLTEIPSSQSMQQKANNAVQKYLTDDIKTDVKKEELAYLNIETPSIHNGLIASGDQFINSSEKQQELLKALPELLAVEMEGAAVAQVAHEYGLPFIVIRIISDKANEDSHIDFPRFIEKVASHFTAGIIRHMV